MLKQSLIALFVCSSMAACAATATKNSPTKGQTVAFTTIKTLASPTVLTANDKVIRLEKIMSDPDWIGQQPENAYWRGNSQQIYYQRKRAGSALKDWYVQDVTGANATSSATSSATIVPLDQQHTMGDAVYAPDGRTLAYVFAGDVFVQTLPTQQVTQVTYSAQSESAPQFLNNGRLAYKVDDNYFAWDLNTHMTVQLVDLKMADKPVGVAEPSSYIAKAQHQLLGFVALEHKNSKAKAEQKEQLKAANPAVFDQSWFLGKGNTVVDSSLSPNGLWLAVAVQKDVSWRDEGDIMPNYITQDGTLAAQNARRRVADTKPQPQQLFLLDLQQHQQYELAFDSLPGWDEDVLAAVKTENYLKQGKVYQSKPAARMINLRDQGVMKWNSQGDKLAMMLDSFDHKDRWLATVDFKTKKLISRHRLHDDAWVNYAFNDFGWFNHSDQLYYLSEESGFSHLYVIGKNGKTRQLTNGDYEVSDLTLASDDQFVYFKANRKHPGIYEAYRVATTTAKIEQLTDLNGTNDYTLSPDGSKLLIVHAEPAMPPELYVQDLQAQVAAKRLTYTVSDEFLSYNWNIPAIVPVKSSEVATPIFTKVFYPKDHLQGPKRRGVMFIHGAGYTQNSHLGWSYYFREFMFDSMLTQQGYVVIDMDYRASKGYGRDWRTAIYRQMGTPELQDMKDGVEWMVNNANVDRARVGVYGGSYGGFMTVMSLFKAPDLFQAGAAIRLVADWAYYNFGYTSNILNMPEDDPIAYARSSPIYFAQGLKNHLLINAPMVDDNVFFQDTVRLVQRMIELEKENFETAIYPVEPHGFRQASSWLDEYRRIYKLFQTHL